MINYYSLLGLTEAASSAEIKIAFKKLALQYHPDKHSGDPVMEERFKEVNQAYQVLSNPYEKARYDIRLKYGAPNTAQSYYQPPPPRPYRRPSYTEPEIDWKENWRATAYAFAFTFVLATIVMSGIGVKEFLDAEALKERLAQRRARFEQAKSQYKLGNVDTALETINGLGVFMDTEADMLEYKNELYNNFIFEGEHNFNNGEYGEAIYYFELIEEHAERKPLPLREHLALAYRNTNQPHKSLKVFTELLISGYRSLETYIQMAEIHRDLLEDQEEAKRYFEIASDQAIKKYEAIYGDAYPLVITGKLLPEHHYRLYTGLADSYLKTGDYTKAVKATRWNINVWPDSAANYAIAARGYQALGVHRKACESYTRAVNLGYRETIHISCP